MRPPSAFSLALIACLGLASAPAAADEVKQPTKAQIEEAQKRYQRGRELYEENDFRAALVEIKRAYELAPNYRLLYDIAQIHYQIQDYPGALRAFSQYLGQGRGEIPATRRDEVQAEIDRLKTRVATLRIVTNKPSAEILVDDAQVGKAPLSEPVLVSAGRRKISATLPGYETVTKVVEVAGMDTVDVRLDFAAAEGKGGEQTETPGAPRSSVEGAPPPSTAGGGRGALWIGWTVTGGLAVAAGVTGVLALGASSDLDTKLNTAGATRDEIDAARSKTKALALTTDILLGATLVAAGTSLVFTLTSGSAKKASAGVPLRVGIGVGSVSLRGAF